VGFRLKKPPEQKSMIGKMIDMPIEDFKKELIEVQKVNVGTVHNLILNLEMWYADLRQRKDGVLDLVFKKEKTREEVQKAIEGLYAEMTKIEEKVVWLKEYEKTLSDGLKW